MEGELEDGYYVEIGGQAWRSSFNHQVRPDPSRAKSIISKEKLVQKRGRFFTTDTSDKQLTKEIAVADNHRKLQANPGPRKTYAGKNQ